MGRMPYHIHVFLYREKNGTYEFAVFERSDLPEIWQGVSGGGEAGESVVQTALRECREEAGVVLPGPLYPLDSVSVMRSTVFAEWTKEWGRDVIVLPMYFFGMPYAGEIVLSEEHITFEWLNFEQADARIALSDQNTALWELNERLCRNNLERSVPMWMDKPWKAGY
ncbi:MAG: NUDIX domain-containing protein [Christensenella sp.]|uniref:NUDIX domain-containing protein n=1 Tax=Christensenella sp. TaxID=1935934 RepID=UPI002B20403E|nr:NUDIX domain-containing protein [Christensenella sp.]MEA5002571.1 NUDIX domain-containing protein [Christensenella sp.]